MIVKENMTISTHTKFPLKHFPLNSMFDPEIVKVLLILLSSDILNFNNIYLLSMTISKKKKEKHFIPHTPATSPILEKVVIYKTKNERLMCFGLSKNDWIDASQSKKNNKYNVMRLG